MKKQEIILEKPFSLLYNKGYIFIRPDNRKYIQLYNSNTNNKMLSYARYLMGVKLGYEVPSEFEVDHIDNNPFNDSIENLQLLSKVENIKKYRQHFRDTKQEYKYLICNNCQKEFKLTLAEYSHKLKEGITSFYCNRDCYLQKNKNSKINIKCNHCDKDFNIHKSKFNDNKNKIFYCSNECLRKNKIKNVELICSNCRMKFNIKKYEYNKKISEGNKNFFCNSNCRIHFKQRNNKSVSCAYCNKELEQNEIEYKIINNKTKEEKYYCSRKCFYNTVNMHTV